MYLGLPRVFDITCYVTAVADQCEIAKVGHSRVY